MRDQQFYNSKSVLNSYLLRQIGSQVQISGRRLEKGDFKSTESIPIQVRVIVFQWRMYIIDWSFQEMKDKSHISAEGLNSCIALLCHFLHEVIIFSFVFHRKRQTRALF